MEEVETAEGNKELTKTDLDSPKKKDNLVAFLDRLKSEAADLLEQKRNLADRRDGLLLRVNAEINTRKDSIEKLKVEITEIKTDCEELATSLKAGH